jgi:conjugal transfer pilus assembly protein TraW
MKKLYKQSLLYALFLGLVLEIPVEGKDFGIQGELFSIVEENIIHVLQKQSLTKFSPTAYQRLLKQAEEKAKHPVPRFLLPEATKNNTFYYDPTFIAPETIHDRHGTVIVEKGTKINPLKELQLPSGLLFLDGENPQHIQWAREQKGSYKWILLHGNPFELEKQEKRPVYFDQNGFSVSKFHFKHIPVRITQEGLQLKVEEIAISKPETS